MSEPALRDIVSLIQDLDRKIDQQFEKMDQLISFSEDSEFRSCWLTQ